MELGIGECVERHEIIRHDAAASIHRSMLTQGVALERVGKVNTVGTHQFAMLQSVHHIHGVILGITLGIGFLNATACRGVIMRHGESDHRTVGQVDGALHKSLAKGSATYDHSTVLVLYGTRDNLGGRSRILVDEHHNLSVEEFAVALGLIFIALHSSSLGIYYKIALLQKFVGYIHRCLQITASVALKVEDEVAHTLLGEFFESLAKLVVGGGSEVADAHISHLGTYHIHGIDRLDGYLVAHHLEGEGVLDTASHYSEHHLSALRSAQSAHDILLRHLHSCDGSVVDRDDAVACHDTHLL